MGVRIEFAFERQQFTAALAGMTLTPARKTGLLRAIGVGLQHTTRDRFETWWAPFTGYHLYCPSRRQPSAAFAVLVDALRSRASNLIDGFRPVRLRRRKAPRDELRPSMCGFDKA